MIGALVNISALTGAFTLLSAHATSVCRVESVLCTDVQKAQQVIRQLQLIM